MKPLCSMIPATVLSVLLTGCGSVSRSDTTEPMPISTGYVRVPEGEDHAVLYAQADPSAEQVAVLHQNDPLDIYSLRDGWFYVAAGTQRGFLEGDSVCFTPASVPAETAPDVTTAPILTIAAETVPSATEPVAAAPAPVETPVLKSDPTTPGEILIPEEDVLKFAQNTILSYHDHVYFSVFTFFNAPNGDAELQTETITVDGQEYQAQKGIKVHGTAGHPVYIEGWLQLYKWEWKDQAGGEIIALPEGEQAAICINTVIS